MTRRLTHTPIALAMLIASLMAAAAIAAPASAKAADIQTFKPVRATRHALVFAPRTVPADAVRRAWVRLHNRRSGASRVRDVPVAKVRHAIEIGSRVRVRKAPSARGRLKVRVGAIPGSTAIPADWQRSASFETSLNSGTDYGWRADSPFQVTRTSEVGGTSGSYAAKIVTNGGNGGCSCPRMTYENGFSYGAGDSVWMSGSWYVTDPSKLAWSRLMNLGHFESSGSPGNWYLALLVKDPSNGIVVTARNYNTDSGESNLARLPIPADRWFQVDLHFVLSPTDGQALTEVYLNGSLVATSTKSNMWANTPLTFYNAGLSYFWPGNGNTTVYFDAPELTS